MEGHIASWITTICKCLVVHYQQAGLKLHFTNIRLFLLILGACDCFTFLVIVNFYLFIFAGHLQDSIIHNELLLCNYHFAFLKIS